MSDHFADTNLFLRYLTDDIPDQADHAERLLQRAKTGSVSLKTNVMVVAEIVWTLESYYHRTRADIRDKVLGMLNTPGLTVEEADLVAQAVELYAGLNVDFIDAFNSLWMGRQGLKSVVTFDVKHYARLPGVVALTPDKVR
jgi:predicted nucleic-acid-binding protein